MGEMKRIVHVEMGVLVVDQHGWSDESAEEYVREWLDVEDAVGVTYFCMRTQQVPEEETR